MKESGSDREARDNVAFARKLLALDSIVDEIIEESDKAPHTYILSTRTNTVYLIRNIDYARHEHSYLHRS